MNWQWTPYTFLIGVTTLIAFISAFFVWYRFRHKPAARMGAVLILLVGSWLLGSLLEISSIQATQKIFWDKAQFVAIVILPAGWLMYALRYVGRTDNMTVFQFILLWFIPGLTLLLVFTNEAHWLVWSSYKLSVTDGVITKLVTYGPGFWLFLIYANVVVLLGAALLLQLMVTSGRFYRWQIGALLMIVLVPWMVDIASLLFNWRPFLGVDLTPLALAITVSAAGWTVYRLQVWDIGPVARHMVIEQMGDGVVVLDEKHCIVDVNPAMLSLLQMSKSELFGRPISQVWPDWPDELFDANRAASVQTEWALTEPDMQTFDIRVSPLFDGRKRLVSWVVVLRDMEERKRMEEQLRQSLREKDMLFKEIHHRVKNNLQIISSLLSLQASQASDGAVSHALLEGQNRVRSMALIHEILYRADDLGQIDFGAYVRELTARLYQTYSFQVGQVELAVQTDAVFLTMETAVTCGLIINELVSNALKHAFSDGRSGKVTIHLQAENQQRYHLTISDDGIGLPPKINYRQTTTLGLQLVNTLVEQLEGNLTVNNHQGTSITITFEVDTPKGSS